MVILVLLAGCSSNSAYRHYSEVASCSMDSDVNSYMLQNKEKDINIQSQQKKKSITGVHEYNNTNYNSYHEFIYTVRTGDTLFYIAWITGNDCLNLAKINNIKDINVLKAGQVLKLYDDTIIWSYLEKISRKFLNFFKNSDNPVKVMFLFIKKQLFFFRTNKNSFSDMKISHDMFYGSEVSELEMTKYWYWPTNGTIINVFSDTERGNKGIDISGMLGQPILAAADGRVVYIGSTLKGYGNLIIIKHGRDYLSAYAHNDMILVTEQQKVQMGDKIATMGNSGTNEVKLHFEIRYKGKSVDPLFYLPNR
nr:peptidoglycan DD-metalloendopeptidase family protein [Blochmannia endosymbiont of Camponotus nipponensis]